MRLYGLAALRLCVGSVFLVHGAQKLFGVFGDAGLPGASHLLATFGVPYPHAAAIALGLAELGGGALLMLGGLTLWVALALLADVALTVWKVHYPRGFTLSGGLVPGHAAEAELHLVLIGALLCLALAGPGALSIDQRRSHSAEAQARGRARARKV